MTDLPVRTQKIALPPPPGARSRSIRSYKPRSGPGEREFSGYCPVFLEPSARYHRRRSGPHPFNKDLRWKIVTEDLPGEFLSFFAPGIAAEKDPEQQIAFLDKELLELFPVKGQRLEPIRVDKLLKVPMRDGSAVILHCEVQGSREAGFSARMYLYFNRLWDKYPQAVEAIAVLTDGDPAFRPQPYRERGRAGADHRLCYHYKVYKVLDQSEEVLEQSDNPFALVILTTKAALKRIGGEYTEEEYLRRKIELVNWLKEKTLTAHQEQALLSFLEGYVPFTDKTMETEFNEYLKERSEVMGTLEFLMNEAREKAERSKELAFARNLIRATDFNDGKIASLTGLEEDTVIIVRAEMLDEAGLE